MKSESWMTKTLTLCLTLFLLLCPDYLAFGQNIVASVPVGIFPTGVAVNRLTNRVYVANLVGHHFPVFPIEIPNTVTVIDGETNTVVDEIVTGLDFQIGLAVDEVRNLIYVTTLDNGVDVLDGKTDKVIGNIPVSGEPAYVGINTLKKSVYVSNQFSSSLTIIDEDENDITATVPLGGGSNVSEPEGVAVDPFTNRIYVTNFKPAGVVWMIDGRTNTVGATIPVGSSPFGLAVNPLTRRVYVANSCAAEPVFTLCQSVSVIDEHSNKVKANIPVAGNPFHVAVDEVRDRIYSCDLLQSPPVSFNLSMINGKKNKVERTVALPGAYCGGLAVDTFRNHVYLTDENTDSLTVLKGP
jgi:YVTN family beta-propeller protein